MSPRRVMISRETLKELDRATLRRLLDYFGAYKILLAVVVVCVLIGAVASAAASLFLRTLIDDYITPWSAPQTPTSPVSPMPLP